MMEMENSGIGKAVMRVRSLPEAFPVVGKRLEDLGLTGEDLENKIQI